MNPNCEPNALAHFIRKNFMGATITVTLVNGQTLTGEVVDGFDNVIALKAGAVITFINAFFIVSFV
jgi:hypothetical protein